MEGTNERKKFDMLKTHVENKHWFISSVLLFLLIATAYLIFTPNNYKVQTRILVNNNFSTAESVADNIKSKDFVQKALDDLPFQVNYYQSGTFKRIELYGDSLPIKFVFPKNNAVDSTVVAKVNILSSQVFEIERNKVAEDFYFDKPVNYSFAKFKATKGPSFKANGGDISLEFNDPGELLEYYYDHFKAVPAEDRYLQLSVVTTIPEKGVDFLNKIVEEYNKSNASKATVTAVANTDVSDRLQTLKERLTALKTEAQKFKDQKAALSKVADKPVVHKVNNEKTAVTLTVLDAISPYAKKPVNQFIQIPYGDETNNKDLETAINEFNKTELSKQRLLQDSQANKLKINNFNEQIAVLKMSILQKIEAQKDQINGVKHPEPTNNNVAISAAALNDSISRTAALIKSTRMEYTDLSNHKPVKISAVAAVKPVLTIIEKPGETVISYPQPIFVYFLAFIIGLTLPLSLPYFKRIRLPKNNWIDLKKFNARIYELLHTHEID